MMEAQYKVLFILIPIAVLLITALMYLEWSRSKNYKSDKAMLDKYDIKINLTINRNELEILYDDIFKATTSKRSGGVYFTIHSSHIQRAKNMFLRIDTIIETIEKLDYGNNKN